MEYIRYSYYSFTYMHSQLHELRLLSATDYNLIFGAKITSESVRRMAHRPHRSRVEHRKNRQYSRGTSRERFLVLHWSFPIY